jgi:hypothetical protein
MSPHVCAGTVLITFEGFGSVHRRTHTSAESYKNLVILSSIKLRKVCQHERKEVPGDWRKLRNDEFHCCHLPGDQIKNDRGARQITCMQERRDAYWCWWYSGRKESTWKT